MAVNLWQLYKKPRSDYSVAALEEGDCEEGRVTMNERDGELGWTKQ